MLGSSTSSPMVSELVVSTSESLSSMAQKAASPSSSSRPALGQGLTLYAFV